MRLSSHFTLRELVQSQVATRRGIDNTPDAGVIENLKRVCEGVLEPVRAHFGFPYSPTSGYRSPALNRAIGGAPKSQHIRGEAVDLNLPGVANTVLARWIRDNIPFDQLILEFPDPDDPAAGWVHCSLVASGYRRDVLTCTRNGYTRGFPPLPE